jgi:hypothetical protein
MVCSQTRELVQPACPAYVEAGIEFGFAFRALRS